MPTLTTAELIDELVAKGGAIVSSNDCHEIEIADAQQGMRFAVDAEGFGFVLRSHAWLELQKDHEKAVKEKLFHRRCWQCGARAYHKDTITPHVNCERCGSQDTRPIG